MFLRSSRQKRHSGSRVPLLYRGSPKPTVVVGSKIDRNYFGKDYMPVQSEDKHIAMLENAARQAGLVLTRGTGTGSNTGPTAKFRVSLDSNPPSSSSLDLELSEGFD